MIDPISAFALVKTAHSTLMHGIKMGRDFASMGSSIAKFAKGEASLAVAKEKKSNSIFGSVIGGAIDDHFKEEGRKKMYDQLRSMVRLYGSAGQWERLAATIQAAKAEHRRQLKKQQEIAYKKQVIGGVSLTLLIGIAMIYYFAMYLKGEF